MATFGFGVLEPTFIYTVCCVRAGGGEAPAWSTDVVTVHDVNVDCVSVGAGFTWSPEEFWETCNWTSYYSSLPGNDQQQVE